MARGLALFAVGIIAGAALVGGGLAAYNKTTASSPQPEAEPEMHTQSPQPSPAPEQSLLRMPNGLSGMPGSNQEWVKPIQVTVGTTFPGIGFIAADSSDTQIFVAWEKDTPTEQSQVSISGDARWLPADTANQDMPDPLRTFLNNQSIYLVAEKVEPVPSV